jgi:N-acetylmuramoyl-L-alanine amidase
MKKAQVNVAIYFRLFEIILLVMVVSIVALELRNVQTSGVFEKKFITRDLALTIDSFQNARGNLNYFYNPPLVNLDRFDIIVDNGVVGVDEQSWPFGLNRNFVFNPLPKGKFGYLAIKKEGNVFSVDKGSPATGLINGFMIDCAYAKLQFDSVILDPGHGYNADTNQGEPGFLGQIKDNTGGIVPESQLMVESAVALVPQLKGISITGTRALKADYVQRPQGKVFSEEAKTTQERVNTINANKDAVVVSIHAGKQKTGQNIVKAYVNAYADEKSQRLACFVLNSISKNFKMDITGTAIIPVDPMQLRPDDAKKVLVDGRTAIQVELGNIDNPTNALLTDKNRLAQALSEGLMAVRVT